MAKKYGLKKVFIHAFMDGRDTVSYTHLDVYKRQQVKGEDEDGYRIGKIAAFQIQSLLDVYKRQVHSLLTVNL